MSLCQEIIPLTNAVWEKAIEFENAGIKPIDALHLAVAVANRIKYLCTCDDKFIKNVRKLKNIGTKVILPTDLIKEVVK